MTGRMEQTGGRRKAGSRALAAVSRAVAQAVSRGPATAAMRCFALATLGPAVLILLAVLLGGFWGLAALVTMTVVVALLDRFVAGVAPHVPGDREFPAADRLSVLLALVHLALMPLVIWGIAGDSGLSGGARVALFVAAGLWFGQVGNSNAHELIHRSGRGLFRLGVAVYVSLLFGHHVSAHRHVHHRFVATEDDPNTARRGESFHAFLLRAWPAGFAAGHEIETALRQRRRDRARWQPHPYVWYLGGAGLWVALVGWAFGVAGVAVLLGLAAHAQVQLFLSDYVQHYGLMRRRMPDGRLEPVGPQHSWDAPHWASSALMLNAPRHADHHAHPARPYPALELPEGAPCLPYGLPVMAVIALWPRRWRRLMDPRLPKR